MRITMGVLFIMIAAGIMGCTGVHESVEQGGQVVGSVAAIPQSAGQGITQGYVIADSQPNPYNR